MPINNLPGYGTRKLTQIQTATPIELSHLLAKAGFCVNAAYNSTGPCKSQGNQNICQDCIWRNLTGGR